MSPEPGWAAPAQAPPSRFTDYGDQVTGFSM